jgi:PAS domain S-box-containing protein
MTKKELDNSFPHSQTFTCELIIKELEKAKLILDMTDVIFVAFDKNGRVIFINENANFVAPTEWEKVWNQTEKSKHGVISSYELDLVKIDGSIASTRISTVPYYDNNTEFNGTIAVIIDITDLKQTEKTLRQKDVQYRELISLLPAGVVICDLDEKMILVNEGMAKILDISIDKLVGRNLFDFIHKKDRQKLVYQTSQRKEGKISSYDIRLIRKDGEEEIVAVHAAPKSNIDGKVDGSVGIFVDVTKQRIMEETLERERAILKVITDSAADAIVMIDDEGKIIFWNLAAEKMFGYSQDEIIGQSLNTTIIQPKDREAFTNKLKAFRDLSQTPTIGTNYEFRGMKKDGTIIPAEVSTAPIMIGERRGYVTSIRDISERVKIQELKGEQHRELELYASLLRHDLRNDLGVILGNVDIAHMIVSEEDQEMQALIASTEAVCNRMMKVLRALGRRSDHIEKNIVELVMKTASQAQDAETNLIIEVNVSEEVGTFEIPSSRLLPMVFENLFRNAAVYAGEDSIVKVNISRKKGNIEIFVSDNGPGIDESIRDNLFQKGVSTRGSGLGLYLSKEIVTAIGGTIELAENKFGQGACFRIILPKSN